MIGGNINDPQNPAAYVSFVTIDLGPAVRAQAERAASGQLDREVRIGRLGTYLLPGRFHAHLSPGLAEVFGEPREEIRVEIDENALLSRGLLVPMG